ncbi:MAG: diacylglycerol kinase family protein, partial [Microbacterium sp.]|uniref:diacylglycerol kinase family protein n=1 Tax=Microbacterium sp. TaxID=51671 RepID=UPI0039E70110
DRAAARLRERGARVTLVAGGSASETTDLLHGAVEARPDAVVVAGGDGTVRLAAQALRGTGVPLGVVPAGTGNDLATHLGLRRADPEAAADVVLAGHRRRIDLARVTDSRGAITHYATVLACGFDARVNDRANAMRWPRGGSRYTLALLREFVALHADRLRVTLHLPDGGVHVLDEQLLIAAVGNSRSYGGGIPVCPDADLGDGLLEVAVVAPVSRLRLLRLLPRLYAGTHAAADEVTIVRARAVELDAADAAAYADGDLIGPLPLRVDADPAALEVFVAP